MKEHLISITKKDLRVDTFRAGGKGGQNQNKRNTGCRITHRPSGAVGEGRDSRDFASNRANAFTRMAEGTTFQTWLRVECARMLDTKEVEQNKEVIRTYSFVRNQVKDHRTKQTLDLKETLDGNLAG